MKKSKIKGAVKFAMSEYYDIGLTRTASVVKDKIFSKIDKLYDK